MRGKKVERRNCDPGASQQTASHAVGIIEQRGSEVKVFDRPKKRALARQIDEVREITDEGDALRQYAKQARES